MKIAQLTKRTVRAGYALPDFRNLLGPASHLLLYRVCSIIYTWSVGMQT